MAAASGTCRRPNRGRDRPGRQHGGAIRSDSLPAWLSQRLRAGGGASGARPDRPGARLGELCLRRRHLLREVGALRRAGAPPLPPGARACNSPVLMMLSCVVSAASRRAIPASPADGRLLLLAAVPAVVGAMAERHSERWESRSPATAHAPPCPAAWTRSARRSGRRRAARARRGPARRSEAPRSFRAAWPVPGGQSPSWAESRTTNFRSVILLAANLGAEADTTAAIAGQPAGARLRAVRDSASLTCQAGLARQDRGRGRPLVHGVPPGGFAVSGKAPQPIRHVEEARLPRHRRHPAQQVRIESACRPAGQRFLEVSRWARASESQPPQTSQSFRRRTGLVNPPCGPLRRGGAGFPGPRRECEHSAGLVRPAAALALVAWFAGSPLVTRHMCASTRPSAPPPAWPQPLGDHDDPRPLPASKPFACWQKG